MGSNQSGRRPGNEAMGILLQIFSHFPFFHTNLLSQLLQSLPSITSPLTSGHHVAELELHIAMAHIVQNFRVEYPETAPVGIVQKFFLIPDRPINLAFVEL